MEKLSEKLASMSLSDVEKKKEGYEKDMKAMFEKYKLVQETHKKLNKEVKDAERKKATALKNAEKKERERAMREEEVTITVNFAGRSPVTITVPLTCTVGNLRKLLAVKMSMAVSQSVRIVLSFNGRVISDNPRRLLYGLQITDGATLDGEIAEKKKKKSMASDSNALRDTVFDASDSEEESDDDEPDGVTEQGK
eukprot:Skav201870  [mRNA]  locus=scaffold793:5909:6493:- [translate_table: standard]